TAPERMNCQAGDRGCFSGPCPPKRHIFRKAGPGKATGFGQDRGRLFWGPEHGTHTLVAGGRMGSRQHKGLQKGPLRFDTILPPWQKMWQNAPSPQKRPSGGEGDERKRSVPTCLSRKRRRGRRSRR